MNEDFSFFLALAWTACTSCILQDSLALNALSSATRLPLTEIIVEPWSGMSQVSLFNSVPVRMHLDLKDAVLEF